MVTRSLHLRRPAAPTELRGIRRLVGRWAAANDLCADDTDDLQLALGEAVANGVEHAYRDGETGIVELELELRGSARDPQRVVQVRVADHGRWRPVPEHRGHRGRGIALIRQLSTTFRMSAGGRGTEVCFEIALRT